MGAIAAEAQSVSLRALINPHERQEEFFRASDAHKFTLYGGARGGGKSYILRWTVVRFLLRLTAQGFTNVRGGVFCETYPELRLRQWEPAQNEFPSWLGKFNGSEMQFKFHPKWGGHVISFLNLDNQDKYKSAEFAIVAVDELTLCPDRSILNTFMGSMRWPNLANCKFIAATNPDGPGHSWVKRLFYKKDFSHPDDSKLKPEQFAFVKALPTDNPYLSTEYIEENLAGLPESKRKPWLEGSWDLFEGQRFEFNPRVHVLKAKSLAELGPAKYYRSLDYGFDNPYACGWYAVTSDDHGKQRIYKIREDVRSGLKAHEQIKRVHEITEELGLTGKIELSYLDTACWKQDDDGLSIADKFIQGGIPVVQALKDRAAGWVELESELYFEWVTGSDHEVAKEPGLKFFDNCVLTSQQITDAMWDPKKPGDILHPEGFRDDALDETRYFVLSHKLQPSTTPQQTWVEEHRERAKYMARTG